MIQQQQVLRLHTVPGKRVYVDTRCRSATTAHLSQATLDRAHARERFRGHLAHTNTRRSVGIGKTAGQADAAMALFGQMNRHTSFRSLRRSHNAPTLRHAG